MEELRACYMSLGFRKVSTYIQSGNVVFEDESVDAENLAKRIETGVKATLDLNVRVMVRSKEEMTRVVKNNPFKGKDESKLHVTFLGAKPDRIPMKEINEVRGKGEEFSVSGREVYLFCPNGYGRTKLSNSFFEKVLKTQATTRNWRTVNALCALEA